MDVHYYERNVFGNRMLYPANEAAQQVCKLLNQKTLTERDVALLAGIKGVTTLCVPTPKGEA